MTRLPPTTSRPIYTGPEAWDDQHEPAPPPRRLGWPFTIGVILGAILPLAALIWFTTLDRVPWPL